ncbi:hydroxyphenylacetyl-CoA thioesterase PaaI [Actinomadura barringtoniae]|uniref:Hydroxyphenylacetyl-CoA thioesterase PaaI n=2 Tax=Actinomadura barringtoniae TaxID=1427535 RepID=A0A939T4F3_9ACTN|nr:hydroxyphenylacetyl-CoA thioesterase PaaI [Actinomadura barringtoniae]
MYERDLAVRHLGIEITDIGPGLARARMTIAPEMVNGHDVAHGGYLFLLADTAFAYACNSYDTVAVAAAAEVVFVAPAHTGDLLEAHAAERTRYGRNGIYDVTVRRVEDESVIAEFRGSSRSLRDRVIAEDTE